MPGSDASQFTRFKKASAVQRGDTQQSDPKSVNRLTQYIPRLSGISGLGKFLSSLTKTSSSDSSVQENIVTITSADVSNGSISFTVQAGKLYFRNDSGQPICVGGMAGATIINGQTLFITELLSNDPLIGTRASEQVIAGACPTIP
jgi:hypothetical protein